MGADNGIGSIKRIVGEDEALLVQRDLQALHAEHHHLAGDGSIAVAHVLGQIGGRHLCAAQDLIGAGGHIHGRQLFDKLLRRLAGVVGDAKPLATGGIQIVEKILHAGQRRVADVEHAVHVEEDGADG